VHLYALRAPVLLNIVAVILNVSLNKIKQTNKLSPITRSYRGSAVQYRGRTAKLTNHQSSAVLTVRSLGTNPFQGVSRPRIWSRALHHWRLRRT